jgi:hypothetical protein
MHRTGVLSPLFVLAACAAGCTSSTTVTTVAGDTVTNAGGVGTGSVADVSIEVRGLTTGEASVMPSVQTLAGPSGNYSRELWAITLGEVKILFERHAEGPIELTVDENFYGTIQAGDALLIDENRTVFVNGVERATTARDFRDPVPRESTNAAGAGD